MKFDCRVLFLTAACVVTVSALNTKQDAVRDKRTLDIILKALAESLGYDVAKRPPPMPLPKPAAVPRSGVNPPLAPAAPAPKTPPPAPPASPKMPPPPPRPAPKAPAPVPVPRVPPPAAPKAPAPPMAMMPLPQPKSQVAPAAPAKPRLPTVPPLLTETVQKMFNINFNWNKNVQPSLAPIPIPRAPVPVPKAPAPVPKAPNPTLAPKAPTPTPTLKSSPPLPKASAPVSPKSTAAPGKIIYYDYDDPQNGPYTVSLRDYDGYYNYENDNAQQEEKQPQQEEQHEQEQPQEEEQNQNVENSEQNEDQNENKEAEEEQYADEKQRNEYHDSVQNFWANSPWHHNNDEKYNAESSVPEFYKSNQFYNPNFAKHDFLIHHPSGSSYSKMEHKKVEPIKTNQESAKFQVPLNYYVHNNEPQRGENLQIHNNNNKQYNYEGPSLDQYYYIIDNEPKQQPQSDSHKIEINNNGVNGIKESSKTEKEYQASVPIPLHVINQENPFVQWVSIEQAGSENTPNKVPVKSQSQKVIQKTERAKKVEMPLFEFNYQPDHYEADFSAHTIPPPTQQDYSKYNPISFKLEDELSDKAQIQEEQYGRKYTTIHSDNAVHRIHS